MRQFDVVLFDLGGVLVPVKGVESMQRWSNGALSEKNMWHRWLWSPAVRRFESGQSDRHEFASEVVQEFSLNVTPDIFLQDFSGWVMQAFTQTVPLLNALAGDYRLACLSNTNEVHWPRIEREMGFAHHFEHQFLSYKTGWLKPEVETFKRVTTALNCAPERILYLDDNQANVDSAQDAGMRAYLVKGGEQVSEKIRELALLNS